MTPNRRRAAVVMLQARFGVSERRACRVTGQHRSTQRLPEPVPDDEEQRLRAWLRAFARRRDINRPISSSTDFIIFSGVSRILNLPVRVVNISR